MNTSFLFRPLKDVAKLILNDARENVTSRLEELIWNLLAENKLSLAFHLNRCCELMFPSNKRVVTSWLIRAIILSKNILHDVRQLSNILKKDFSNFVPEIFSV
ncbi:MAG: hypothetical protein IPK14_11980 [Blastocatellia bacterium]|nr:hypothetical protein [Blastocatellia bacterium]